MYIGVDTHKKTHVLVALDARGQAGGTLSGASAKYCATAHDTPSPGASGVGIACRAGMGLSVFRK